MNARRTAFILIMAALLAARASAQTDDSSTNARRHFEDGSKAFNLGEFARAIKEYRAAYNLKPDPVLLYNIAQSYRLAGELTQALFFYRSYLANVPSAPNRREVQDRISTLETQIAQQKAVTTQPPNTTVAPGTTPAPGPGLTPAPPGRTVDLTPRPSPAAGTTQPASARAQKTPVYKKWWLWTVVGVVAAGAAVGIGVGVTQSSSHFDAPLGTVGPSALGTR
jgi:tetratricopeptide (TPR) repeat protein